MNCANVSDALIERRHYLEDSVEFVKVSCLSKEFLLGVLKVLGCLGLVLGGIACFVFGILILTKVIHVNPVDLYDPLLGHLGELGYIDQGISLIFSGILLAAASATISGFTCHDGYKKSVLIVEEEGFFVPRGR